MTELNVLLFLFSAHIISDFFLQTKSGVKSKNEKKIKSNFLYFHVLSTGILSYLALVICGIFDNILIPTIIMFTHWGIDLGKIYYKKNNFFSFVTDQFLHLLVILTCWLIYTEQWCRFFEIISVSSQNKNTVIVILSYLLITKPSSLIIGMVVQRSENAVKLTEKKESVFNGLENAGEWIGYLERILILTFALIQYYEGIGFLFAAKSIFRFGELTRAKERALTEYILIGTLLSFVMAIIIGVLANLAMKY